MGQPFSVFHGFTLLNLQWSSRGVFSMGFIIHFVIFIWNFWGSAVTGIPRSCAQGWVGRGAAVGDLGAGLSRRPFLSLQCKFLGRWKTCGPCLPHLPQFLSPGIPLPMQMALFKATGSFVRRQRLEESR